MRFRRFCRALCVAFVITRAPSAFADERACRALEVDADPAVLTRWPGLPQRVQKVLAAREDLDRCAQIKLSMAPPSIVIDVVLVDGRSASRSLAAHEDVLPALEALLLVPEPEPTGEPSVQTVSDETIEVGPQGAPVRGATTKRSVSRPSRWRTAEALPAANPTHAADTRSGIEFSLLTAARVGDGQTSLGLGAISFLEVSSFLIGLEGRINNRVDLAQARPYATLDASLLVGRRMRFGGVALDFFGGPALIIQEDSSVSTGPAGMIESSTGGAAPRLRFGTHLNFAERAVLRTFMGLEGDVGARADNDEINPNPAPPQLPLWSVGFALGATLGTR
ncbi:MAG: hypothetical protein ACOY0T_16910 [Myxococcota bacterium]